MAADNLALIDEFCDGLWLEDGLSKNTLEAYRRDMRLFASGWNRSASRLMACWRCRRTISKAISRPP
jgi:site-specific recombinase XerD